MRIGVLGSGVVGQVLADGFLKKGHEVMRGSREPDKLSAWLAGAGAKAQRGTFVEAARAIEPLCMLWCIPGFRQNRWNHAFKLLRG